MHFARRFFCVFHHNCLKDEIKKFLWVFLKNKAPKYLFLRREIKNMCVAAKCISKAVSVVFFTLIARNGENIKFLLLLLKNKGLKYSVLPSVMKKMCVAAKCISQAVSFVFFTLIRRNEENDNFLHVFLKNEGL